MREVSVTLIQAHPNSIDGQLPYDGSPGMEPLSSQRYPPLGLLYLASSLAAAGFSPRVIDARYRRESRAAIAAGLTRPGTCLVGISFTSFDLPGARALIRFVRRTNPDAILVVGGPHITHMPATARFLGADYGVRGDGETAIVELARSLEAARTPSSPGLFHTSDAAAEEIPICREPDLDRLAFPDLLQVPVEDYGFPLHRGPATTMITSRGCTFDCLFCGIPHRRTHRTRSPASVVDEMALRVNQGFRYIDFKDDCFSLDLSRAKALCGAILDSGLRIEWGCETRLDRLDEEFVRMARAAGCLNIKVGIESGVDRVRDRIGKRLDLSTAKATFGDLRRQGLVSMAYFLFGHPGETAADLRSTVRRALELDPDIADFLVSVPVPGSPLFQRALDEHKVHPEVWHDVAAGRAIPVYVPDGLTYGEMERVRRGAYLRFYLRPRVVARHLRLHASSASRLVQAASLGTQLIGRHVLGSLTSSR